MFSLLAGTAVPGLDSTGSIGIVMNKKSGDCLANDLYSFESCVSSCHSNLEAYEELRLAPELCSSTFFVKTLFARRKAERPKDSL